MNKKLMKELKTKNVKVLFDSKEKQPKSNKLPKGVNIHYAGVYKFDKAAFEKSHKQLWEQDDVEDFKELMEYLGRT